MSAKVKERAPKGVRPGKRSSRAPKEKRDEDIMNTNDSSIVSKSSVSALYFPDEPDFYRPFIGKLVRRNPLINRGYWLRMHAVEQVARRFLDEDDGRPKAVINLGCGYDPLPFQFWHRYPTKCQSVTFVDVDYPQLIERKRNCMFHDDLLRDVLLKSNVRSCQSPVYLRTDKYFALGCDLRDLTTLERVLKTELDPGCALLFVAEVSITYMPVKDSNKLIRWASTLENARFCMLEQYLPRGPGHPFARTMLQHFDKLQTPVQAVKDYPSLMQQGTRFTGAGWSRLDTFHSLWDLWSDDVFTPPPLRRRLDAVEPFDEWEEFVLFAGHYFLIVASNTGVPRNLAPASTVAWPDAQVQDNTSIPSSPITLACHMHPQDMALTPRRFCAAFALGNDVAAFHGGQGPRQRLMSIDVLRRLDHRADNCNDMAASDGGGQLPDRRISGINARHRIDHRADEQAPAPRARICHTVTTTSGGTALLVGGRNSPSQALPDSWLFTDGSWKQVQDLQPARFRHSAIQVCLPSNGGYSDAVLVYGGKTSDGGVLDVCSIWISNQGWGEIPVIGEGKPAPRFGAAMSSTHASPNRGLLLGGMSSDGQVLSDVWEWNLSSDPLQLQFSIHREHVYPGLSNRLHARFGASLIPFGDTLLLIGGVSRGLDDDFVTFSFEENAVQIRKAAVTLPDNALLVGFGGVAVGEAEVVLSGGGAVCFSMGSFWNQGYMRITKAEEQGPPSWTVSSIASTPGRVEQPDNSIATPKTSPALPKKGKVKKGLKGNADLNRNSTVTPRIRLQSVQDFSDLLATSRPAIIEGLDLGPCTALWNIDYLKEKLGVEREVVVHECEDERMTFKDKNFQYVKKTVGDFLDGISHGARTYLRAVSSSQPNKLPTKLEEDFPAITQDFRLPSILLDVIGDLYHSSPLRISGPVSLWLHYDVLANVLCQIQGSKMLRLYPPSDVQYLDFPPGGSSSNTNVLTSTDPKLRNTHPHIACLKPGDVLFIPPMWCHTATPEQGYSVAVNVFWRNLDKGYAAGKDVYGNRDLQAYENGRRDVEKIVRAFRDVPDDLRSFYLTRLGMEVLEKADRKSGSKTLV
ncbi:LCM-domain-containing protein [Lophiostoma macrostomum CBS 122681]|uniref:tRNA wybutosine-synthesizing protein 4 n=1 Tax=Lophiostoma macrostomum CBS 122681 TaxID=1314788 RepID=A0A6A6TFG8_9PLEO|nr:LCM-domain-containing protein [Lophiostoma macrostomum CBS 122681]